jgi:hypothetical protein
MTLQHICNAIDEIGDVIKPSQVCRENLTLKSLIAYFFQQWPWGQVSLYIPSAQWAIGFSKR